MPVEFNLSHEETISGWEDIVNHPLMYYIFQDTINYIKNQFNIFYNYGDNIVLLYLNQISNRLQNEIHLIIDIQNSINKHSIMNQINKILGDTSDKQIEQTNRLKIIMSLCVVGIYFLSEDLFLPIFDPQYAWRNQIQQNRKLMIAKNKAYGSSWSIMRSEGIADVIHTKIHRIISLLDGADNQYESLKDSFEDIINYCIFCIMRINLEEK